MTGCWYLIDTVCDRPPGICEGCQRYAEFEKERAEYETKYRGMKDGKEQEDTES